MLKDTTGQAVTAERPETVAAIEDFSDQFLGFGSGAGAILKAVQAEPDCAYAQALGALLYMFMESSNAAELAAPYRAKADALAPKATPREQRFIAAVGAWVDGDMPKAIAIHEEVAREHPLDLISLKAGQYHHFNLGDAAGLLRMAETARDANAGRPYFHGLAAFGFEQSHLLEEAEAAARRAMEIRHKDPWAHHALAHVMETHGRVEEGVAFMRSVSDEWADCNSFMLTHNWWHLALYLIDLDRTEEALALYDEKVWGVWKEYSQDQINAVSLLARLELRGVDVGARWQDVADYIAARGPDLTQPFLTLQYLYGLARAGRDEAQTLMEAIKDYAPLAPEFKREAWNDIALPASRGLMAHARGRHETAVAALKYVVPRLTFIGGSHAQRDLFGQIYMDALIRSGQLSEAQQLLEMRRMARPNIKDSNRRLAEVYRGLGLPREAALCAARL